MSTNEKEKTALRDCCYIALFVAIIIVCAYLAIPVGQVSITLQTLAVCLAGGLLGVKRGTVCVAVYILLGICGIPVFAGGKNFYALLTSGSAGFAFAFPLLAFLTAIFTRKNQDKVAEITLLLVGQVIGLFCCYFLGCLWYAIFVRTAKLHLVLSVCVYPFLIPDLLKIALSTVVIRRLKKLIKT